MIPVELTLKNFMSYGAEPVVVPFEGLHVACLSGDNGNGKSAILDAMTYALWGRTRASSVKAITEDDLIRVGANDMEVRFEFELNEQRYRAVRKRRRGKTGEWQFAQRDGTGAWASVGGSSRDVGKQIVQLLSMEYETFLNSAYLQQGRADEFTRQTPDNRKRILSEILGLDRYDRLETKAKERQKARKEQAEEIEREIQFLNNQIAALPAHQQQLQETRAALETATIQCQAFEVEAQERREHVKKLDILSQRVADLSLQGRRLEADIALRERERCERLARLKEIQQTLDQREAIESDYRALLAAKKRRDMLLPDVEAFNKASQELSVVIGSIDIEKERLQGQLKALDVQVQAQQKRRQQIVQMDGQIKALKDTLESEPEIIAAFESANRDLAAAQEAFTELKARNERLVSDLQEIEEVLALLSGPHATCPVCESDLSGSRHKSVLARQETKRQRLLQQKKELADEGRTRKLALTTAQEAARALELQRQESAKRRSELHQFEERRATLSEEMQVTGDVEREAEKLRGELARGEYAIPKKIQRQRFEKELERLSLVKQEYEAVTSSLAILESATRRLQDLQHAESDEERQMAEQRVLDALIAERQREAGEIYTKIETLEAQLTEYEEVKAELASVENDRKRWDAERTNLLIREASLNDYVRGCQEALEQKRMREEAFRKIDEERKIYTALAQAFGRQGVQALIIENAIPELEEEANGLLARITENAMQIRFNTTRETRTTRTQVETLDIVVMDDAGTRPYELFSGGEGFRINFAIRIALSRLLARRSGARLQTLILDEGFGSQDGKGREKLIEVIESIKDDFEKILVITHVEELKDAFTHRIEVTKDDHGSHVHLL